MKLMLMTMFVSAVIATALFTMLTRALLEELRFAREATAAHLARRRR